MQAISDEIYYEDSIPGVTLGVIILPGGTLLIDSPLRAEDARSWKSTILTQGRGTHRLLVNMDEHLTAAGIAGIQSLLEEITQTSTGLNNLSIGELNILFSQGEKFTAVLIARRAYRVLLAKVQDFTSKFQLVFGRIAEDAPNEPVRGEEVSDLVAAAFSS